jgi:hypothetical protein
MKQSEKLDQVRDMMGVGKVKYLRPSECRSFMRRTLAKEFQAIVDGFVEEAKKGSCQHVKLATELLKPIRKGPSRKKGTATRYWEQLDKEQREKERLRDERLAGVNEDALVEDGIETAHDEVREN